LPVGLASGRAGRYGKGVANPARVLADGGPVYAETDLLRPIREPFNAVTAALFIFIAVQHLRRVRRRPEASGFLRAAGWILLIGGVGGTLYHALRVWRGFLLMDFLPIAILILLGSLRLLREQLGSWWAAAALTLGAIAAQVGLVAAFGARPRPSAGYAMLSLLVIGPALVAAHRDHFRHARLLGTSLGAFAVALTFRALDGEGLLPMGTHFLWHIFGAVATWAVLAWFTRRELDPTMNPAAATPRPAPRDGRARPCPPAW
jgi:hemolysin III